MHGNGHLLLAGKLLCNGHTSPAASNDCQIHSSALKAVERCALIRKHRLAQFADATRLQLSIIHVVLNRNTVTTAQYVFHMKNQMKVIYMRSEDGVLELR